MSAYVPYEAFAYKSGEIMIMRFDQEHPHRQDLILFAVGPKWLLKERIEGAARLAKNTPTWLVPGVPEAETSEAKIAALVRWCELVFYGWTINRSGYYQWRRSTPVVSAGEWL